MDFIDRLQEIAKTATKVPIIIHSLDKDESIRLSPMPGGKTIKSYMNGDEIKQLGYEFVFKTKSSYADQTMMQIARTLEKEDPFTAKDESYRFTKMQISSEPFFAGRDERGFFYYKLVTLADLYIKGDVK